MRVCWIVGSLGARAGSLWDAAAPCAGFDLDDRLMGRVDASLAVNVSACSREDGVAGVASGCAVQNFLLYALWRDSGHDTQHRS